MIFHENRLPADDSHEISHLIFFENWERYQNMLSAAVEVCILRVKLTFSEIFNSAMPFLCLRNVCYLLLLQLIYCTSD